MNLDKLILEEKELSILLSNNRAKQRDIHTIEFMAKHGIKLGDTIEFEDGREKVRGVFHRIEYNGVKISYPYVLQFNQDGKVGKRERRCWWSQQETIKLIQSK